MRRKAPAVLRSASQPRSQIMEKTEGMDFSVQVRVKSHLHCVRRKGVSSLETPFPWRGEIQSLLHFSLRYYFGPNHGIYHAASVFTLRGPLFTKFRVR